MLTESGVDVFTTVTRCRVCICYYLQGSTDLETLEKSGRKMIVREIQGKISEFYFPAKNQKLSYFRLLLGFV